MRINLLHSVLSLFTELALAQSAKYKLKTNLEVSSKS